jgi:hypothetical protein
MSSKESDERSSDRDDVKRKSKKADLCDELFDGGADPLCELDDDERAEVDELISSRRLGSLLGVDGPARWGDE